MAWRPQDWLVEGEMDNTTRGIVTGWLRFVGMAEIIRLKLTGDFHTDIAGCKLRLSAAQPNDLANKDPNHMAEFRPEQTGFVGDMTASLAGKEGRPYFEWYGPNGRVVLELDPQQIDMVEGPAWQPSSPHDHGRQVRQQSEREFERYVKSIERSTGVKVVVADGFARKSAPGRRDAS